MTIKVYQIDGKLIQNTTVNFNNNRTYLDLESVGKGTFIIRGFQENGSVLFTEKVVLI
jgi:hypothetical protein